MNKTYVYRKHLREPIRFLLLLELIIGLGAIILLFSLNITNEKEFDLFYLVIYLVIFLIIVLLSLIQVCIMYFIVFRRFKSINITLTDEAIIYSNSKGQIIIPYEEIKRIEFPSINYAGGWLKIIYPGGNIRLTVVLENVGDFIFELNKKLVQKDLRHVYIENKLYSFYKTAVYSDESWDRLYHNIKIQVLTHYLCMICACIIILLNGNLFGNEFILFISLMVPLIGYLVGEATIGSKVMMRINRESLQVIPRDFRYEQRVFYYSLLGPSVVYLLLVLILTAL